MLISNEKLIQGLVENIEQLATLNKDGQTQAILHSSRSMLYELNRRANLGRLDDYYQRGKSLLASSVTASGVSQEVLKDLPDQLLAGCNADYSSEQINRLREAMQLLVNGSAYPSMANEAAKTAISDLIAWELEGYRPQVPEMQKVSDDEKPVVVDAAFLEKYLRGNCPGYENARVTHCNPLPGGFSKNTVLFDVKSKSVIEKFAYRGTQRYQLIGEVMVDVANEFQVVSYAWFGGAQVAEPLWLQSDVSVTGTRFFISRRATGSNLGTAIQAHQEVPAAATISLAVVLAKIHGLPLDSSNAFLSKSHIKAPAAGSTLRDIIRQRITHWHHYWKSLHCGVYPVLELAFKWLLDNAADEGDEAVLVHGDYGLHNILIHEDRVAAVLDWEACHVGDRALDISQLFSGTVGKLDRDRFMQAYIEAGGRPVSEFRLNYFQVMMAMQFMLCTVEAQQVFQQRPGAGTSYCTLGLGFIHHTAKTISECILRADAAK